MDRGKRTLLLIAAVCIAPVIASYAAYWFFPDAAKMNYGELLSPPPSGVIAGTRPDGGAFPLDAIRGKWVYLVAARRGCDEGCQRRLYATRQARKLQNRDQPRVVRLLVVIDGDSPPVQLKEAHPDLGVVRVDRQALEWLPAQVDVADHVYLLDPLGNAILRYPSDPDIKKLSKDLGRLLKASRVG